MQIDRDLLWKAYPDGYIAVLGLNTIGGFTCIGEVCKGSGSGWHFIMNATNSCTMNGRCIVSSGDPRRVRGIAGMIGGSEDDLLPNVDPSDTATWACLLDDMRRALGWLVAEGEVCNLWWGQPPEGPPEWTSVHPRGWRLERYTDRARSSASQGFRFFDIDTNDPALALVLARIQVREETGR